ncbi:MAG TPA: prepilin-type N-terminal cleavage/methylation domain-containing protein [Planctomycetota bacterium]|nr:prepilin-type N-terminal cleavage/methylation domain-containing protein [Planctomycetota bacterium]
MIRLRSVSASGFLSELRRDEVRSRRGFTLIELMVVIIIILILSGMTLAMMSVFMRDQGIRQAGNMVQNTISLSRQYAAEKRVMHFVVFSNNDKEGCGIMRTYKDINNSKSYDNGDLEIEGGTVQLPAMVIFKKAPAWIGITPTGFCTGYTDLSSSLFEKRMRDFQEEGDIILTMRAGRYRAWCMDIDPAAGKIRRGVLLTDEKE